MIFTFADENTDFFVLKRKGKSRVIIKDTPKIREEIKNAVSFGLDVTVYAEPNTYDKAFELTDFCGKIKYAEKEIKYTGVQDLECLKRHLGDAFCLISGIMIPMPHTVNPIYNAEMEKLCSFGADCDEFLYELFDSERKISRIRSWYYENLEKYVINNYMEPQKRLLLKLGKRTIFDIGKMDMQYDLAERMINPISLSKKGFSLGIKSGRSYVSYSRKVRGKGKPILVVNPTRGVMERYVRGEVKGKQNRLETPALVAATEGEYLCEMLERCGYSYHIADEFFFGGRKRFTDYESILVSDGCLFTESEERHIKDLEKSGIKINPTDLLRELARKGEE